MNRRHFLLAAPTLAAAPLLAAPVPKRKVGLGKLLILRWDRYYMLSEDGKTEEELTGGYDATERKKWDPCCFRLSPNGKKIAWKQRVVLKDDRVRRRLCVRDFAATGLGAVDDFDDDRTPRNWLGDSRLLTRRTVFPPGRGSTYEVDEIVDLSTWKSEPFIQPKAGGILNTTADGETWLLVRYEMVAQDSYRWFWSIRTRDGKMSEILGDNDSWVTQHMDLTPDGKAVVYSRYNTAGDDEKDEYVAAIFVRHLPDGKPTVVYKLPKVSCVTSLHWSPDGRRFAYTWDQYDPERKVWVQQGVCTQNADGSDLAPILKCPPNVEHGHEALVQQWR